MKLKKLGLWLMDAIVFIFIAIYRTTTGYNEDNYIVASDSWFPSHSEIYYGGSSHYSVYDEPFFIICMIIMALFLLSSLVLKVKGTDGDGIFVFKFIAYVAAVVSVSYMYSGAWDWLKVIVVGFIALALEISTGNNQENEKG